MKNRVAVIATLLNCALCAVLLFVLMNVCTDKLNNNAETELSDLCRLSVKTTDSAVFQNTDIPALFETLFGDDELSCGIFNGDSGIAIWKNYEDNDILSKTERPDVVGEVKLSREHKRLGRDDRYVIAAVSLGDGTAAVFQKKQAGYTEAFGSYKWIPPIIFLTALATEVFILIYLIGSYNRIMDGIVNVLDQFADGDFSTRFKPLIGAELTREKAANYNSTLSRLQDRIFRQQSRNIAVTQILYQIQNGIIAVDANYNVMFVTPVAKKLLGIAGSPEGKPISQLSKNIKLEPLFEEAMRHEGVYTNEVAAPNPVGRGHMPLRLYVSPMKDGGKAVGAMAMVEDITELKRLEQVRVDFAANVSHELKTPLTSIKGFVETLQNGALENPEMAQKFLKIIMLEADRLTRLINDILSITKLESGKDEVEVKRIRLDEMAYNVCEMLEIHAAEKQVTINSTKYDEPSWIMGNPDRVEQMLINLIENAIKYNKQGGSVTVKLYNQSTDMINLVISDTGIGIAEEHIPRMFERFYRVDKGRSRSMGGTGLGLAIVKHIVQSMNGTIEIQSKLGEGTEFLVSIPKAPGTNNINEESIEEETV